MKVLIYTPETRQYRAEEMGIVEFRNACEHNRFCVTLCPERMEKKGFRINNKKRATTFCKAFVAGGFNARVEDSHDTSTRCGHARYSVTVLNPGMDVVDFLNKFEQIFRSI